MKVVFLPVFDGGDDLIVEVVPHPDVSLGPPVGLVQDGLPSSLGGSVLRTWKFSIRNVCKQQSKLKCQNIYNSNEFITLSLISVARGFCQRETVLSLKDDEKCVGQAKPALDRCQN